MPKERDIIKIIWTNFKNSLRPRKFSGNLIGKDNFGNKYFEIPADPSIGKRKGSRYFEPTVGDKFDAEMPAEWEAWLRGRRQDPPTDEEVLKNKTIADMKKVNAAELEKGLAPKQDTSNAHEFPKYDEYESMPGKNQDRDDDKKNMK